MVNGFPDMEEILAQMKDKFLDTSQEKIDRLNEILRCFANGQGSDADLQQEFRREIHSLKGMGGTFQMPLVSSLSHSFEAFLEGEDVFDEPLIAASHAYIDRLSDLIESGEADNETALNHWLEGLPEKGQVLSSPDGAAENIALVIALDDGEIAAIKENFEQNGFDVHVAKSAVRGFEMALKMRPTAIIASQVLGDMDGAELLRALSATHALSKTKFAMVCPDRRKALDENLKAVHLLSQKNVDVDVMNFVAIMLTA